MFSLWLRPDRHDPESLGATSLSFFAGKALCPPRPWAAWAASLPPPPGARQGKPLGPPGLQKVTIEARPRGALLGPQGGGSEGAGHFSVGSGHLVISARCLCRVGGGGCPDGGAPRAGDRLLLPHTSWETKCKIGPGTRPLARVVNKRKKGAAQKRPGAKPLLRRYFGSPERARAFGRLRGDLCAHLALTALQTSLTSRTPDPRLLALAGKRPEPLPLP